MPIKLAYCSVSTKQQAKEIKRETSKDHVVLISDVAAEPFREEIIFTRKQQEIILCLNKLRVNYRTPP